jgi:hypothetical protein
MKLDLQAWVLKYVCREVLPVSHSLCPPESFAVFNMVYLCPRFCFCRFFCSRQSTNAVHGTFRYLSFAQFAGSHCLRMSLPLSFCFALSPYVSPTFSVAPFPFSFRLYLCTCTITILSPFPKRCTDSLFSTPYLILHIIKFSVILIG